MPWIFGLAFMPRFFCPANFFHDITQIIVTMFGAIFDLYYYAREYYILGYAFIVKFTMWIWQTFSRFYLIQFFFFLNVSEQNMMKKMIQKELIEILPEYLSLHAIKVDVESNFIANVIKEIPMRNDIETGLGFIFLSATTTWHRLSFFRFRSLKNQFVPIQNGLELFPYSNHMRCKQQ